MAKNKTFETESSVDDYLNAISDKKRKHDCKKLVEIFTDKTGLPAKMWGPAIIGFGSYHYKYESGHEGDAPLAGLSSRANAITLYLDSVFENRDELLAKLGKFKTSKACIYVKKLDDIDTDVLAEMIVKSVEHVRQTYPS